MITWLKAEDKRTGREEKRRDKDRLGYIVGVEEVRPMDFEVSAVKDYERPQTKKKVPEFLGLCGYYR